MIDPISIGLAFATAQAAVKGIKSALQLGKDINSVSGELSKFFQASATVYTAQGQGVNVKAKKHKSNAEINAQALDTVMQAKKLRDQEAELKQLFIYTGNAPTWDALIEERTRLLVEQKLQIAKEKREAEAKVKEIREALEMLAWLLLFTAGLALIIFAMFMFN